MSGGERYTGPRQAWALGVILSALGRTLGCSSDLHPKKFLHKQVEAGSERPGVEGP